jgi:uncharacterized protein (TIGR02611 family)
MTGIDRIVAEGIRTARRVVVGVVGVTVLAVGAALLVLPGPAFVVLPIGLGILAIEFEWARRLLQRARRFYETAARTERPPERQEHGPDRDVESSRATTRERSGPGA